MMSIKTMAISSITVACMCFTVAGFAAGYKVPRALQKKITETMKNQKTVANFRPMELGCTQLGGTWKGTCSDDSGSVEGRTGWDDTLTIDQDDCSVVTINGIDAYLGRHYSTNAIAPFDFTFATASYPDWEANGSVLNIRSNYTFRRMNFPVYGQGLQRQKFFVREGKLVTQETNRLETESNGTSEVTVTNSECIYEKAAN